jgi:hypothetical protein
MDPDDHVRLIRDPNQLQILVAGGAGGLMVRLISGMGMAGWVTKKIELPKNWSELVKKYKDVMPAHLKC